MGGTTLLMELAHRFGVQNFVFASSSSVYGGSKSTFFSEEESVDFPVSPYAATKKACELLAYTYHHLYKLNLGKGDGTSLNEFISIVEKHTQNKAVIRQLP